MFIWLPLHSRDGGSLERRQVGRHGADGFGRAASDQLSLGRRPENKTPDLYQPYIAISQH